jgi:hypothetical protein
MAPVTRHQVEIHTEGRTGRVLIDGHDIASTVTNLTFKAGIDQDVPTLHLDLQLIDAAGLGITEADVMLGNGVADTLKRLGWTPPETEQG